MLKTSVDIEKSLDTINTFIDTLSKQNRLVNIIEALSFISII